MPPDTELKPDHDGIPPDTSLPCTALPATTDSTPPIVDNHHNEYDEYDDNDEDDDDEDEYDPNIHPFNPLIPPPVKILPIIVDDSPPPLSPHDFPPTTRKISQVQMDLSKNFNMCNVMKKQLTHQLQGDTGANCGATNDLSLLWDYRTLLNPIPITTYDGNEDSRCYAIGVGVLKLVSNSNTTMPWMMLHTPGSTGTILSPDRYMMDNAGVQSFTHYGNKGGTGTISFQDNVGKNIATIAMSRRRDHLGA